MSEIKELSVDLLEELDKEYEERKECTIKVKTPNGSIDTLIYVDKLFKPKKIHDCVQELVMKVEYAKQFIANDDDKESNVFKMWLMLLVIKHFTSLDVPKDFNKQLAVIEKMLEAEIFYQIFAEFDTNEIHKVMDEIERVTNIINARIDGYESLIEETEAKRQKNE